MTEPDGITRIEMDEANAILKEKHYLGPSRRGWALRSEHGIMVFANPSSRRIPLDWVELVRWCLHGKANGGSAQWGLASRWLRASTNYTTVISYSDPSVGHTGALYRACNWWWAPTWHRLRPPPTGNGRWSDKQESVKDRWIFPLRRDPRRIDLLTARDPSILRRMPFARYREPGGADFKLWSAMQKGEVEV